MVVVTNIRPRISSDERVDQIRQLAAAGESPSKIAAAIGIKSESLGRWLSRMGLDELARPFNRAGPTGRKNVRRRCGSRQAYLDHVKAGEPTDDKCKAAHNAYMARWRERETSPLVPIKPADWTQQAECAKPEYDPRWWDGEDLNTAVGKWRTEKAAAICRVCKVSTECLQEGIALGGDRGANDTGRMRAGKFPKDWGIAS
jgi:transposase-like protein